ncbi:MAG: hypothetical protein RIK87_26505 [Fuerstiella sp.]
MNQPASLRNISDDYEPDPLFTDSLYEARWILLMWLCCFVWTLTVCLTFGYPTSVQPETFPTVLGIPAWVAFGIALPWLIGDVVTIWFCLFCMKDGDLGADPDDDMPAGHPAPDAGQQEAGR